MADYTDKLTLAAWNAATEGRGNVKLVWGTYRGDKTYGVSNRNELIFDGTPLYVIVRPASTSKDTDKLELIAGVSSAVGSYNNESVSINVDWQWDHKVRWFNTVSALNQFNNSETYYYIALVGV